jgi:hypothetical protein
MFIVLVGCCCALIALTAVRPEIAVCRAKVRFVVRNDVTTSQENDTRQPTRGRARASAPEQSHRIKGHTEGRSFFVVNLPSIYVLLVRV